MGAVQFKGVVVGQVQRGVHFESPVNIRHG
jgi:hypothetical protein